jgi:hypothetical protein
MSASSGRVFFERAMNTSLHAEVIIALQGSGPFGVREAGSRGCALPSYTRKVWDFHPHRLMKDRSTSPTYGTRVDLHILHKVLRPPLLAVANYERLPQRIDYPISRCRSRCCVYFTTLTTPLALFAVHIAVRRDLLRKSMSDEVRRDGTSRDRDTVIDTYCT